MRCCYRAICVFVCLAGLSWPQATPQPPTEVQRAIDEFRLQTTNLGLRADETTRSAPPRSILRDWHGRLFENFRNDFLDAVPHEITQNGGDKGLLRRNQYGFNVGGPFFVPGLTHGKSNTYVSLSFESVHERISRTSLRTIATMAERTGDYSRTVDDAGDPLMIYDPNSTRPNPSYNPSQPVSVTNLQYLRDPFPGNRIPADRLNPVALAAIQLYPAPNATIGPFFQNNYFVDSPEVNSASGMIGKVDHSIGERQRISTELAFSNGVLDPAPVFTTIANPGAPNQDFSSRRGSIEHVFTLSAQTVNTATLEASSTTSRGGSENQAAFPVYQFDPYVSMGQAYPASAGANNTYVFSDGLSMRFAPALRSPDRTVHQVPGQQLLAAISGRHVPI